MKPGTRSAHEPVAVGAADGLALGEAGETEGGQIGMTARPLGDEGGHHRAHRRRELEAVTREAHRHVAPLRPDAVQDRVPVGRDVEAAGVAAGDAPLFEDGEVEPPV